MILLVSKPPHQEVLNRIKSVIKAINKPIVSIFLGIDPVGTWTASTLEETALMAVALSKGRDTDEVSRLLGSREDEIRQLAEQEAQKRRKDQKYVRGLFSGGTLCTEAQIIFKDMISEVYSNVPARNAQKLENSLKSQRNTIIDLGEEEFTVGRLHPMIDYTLRNKRILEEVRDPQTAVILLDVVLGYGSNPNPASELSGVILEACKHVSVVCSIIGTDQDPQNKKLVENSLEDAGAIILPTNATACKLAGYIIQALRGR